MAGLDSAVQKIRNAIKVLEQDKKQLEERFLQDEKRLRQESVINAISLSGSITQLRDNVTTLSEMNPVDEVELLLTEKRNAVAQELTRLTMFANSFSDSLDKAVDHKTASQLRDEAIRLQNRYDDSEIKQLIEAGIFRCDSLLKFFNDFEKFRNRIYVSPEEFGEAISGVKIGIDEASKHLSELQKQAAESIIQTLNNDLAYSLISEFVFQILQLLCCSLSLVCKVIN